jgi:signal transduction histidine kinase
VNGNPIEPPDEDSVWSDQSVRALVSLAGLTGFAVAGAAIVLAPIALLMAIRFNDGEAGPDYAGLWTAAAFMALPCALGALRWLVGRRTWAGGSLTVVPSAIVLAAALYYDTSLPGANHDAVWLMMPLLLLNMVVGGRWAAVRARRLFGVYLRVPIAEPYRPMPVASAAGGRLRRLGAWAEWLLTDPATWRDLLWTVLNGALGLLLLAGVRQLVAVGLRVHTLGFQSWLFIVLLALFPAARYRFGWPVLRGYGALTSVLLGPSKELELARRVDHLAQSRADTIDSGAAEMRRIERDLHDGAQARLVALGMTLNAAEQLFESSPEAALSLLTEAKDSSIKALAELRDLVRGIHPPVLADRGLVDAVHALALDLPLRVHFTGELPERPLAPVESAAYFAVSELLANTTKHAAASQVWIEVGHTDGMLRIAVTDDGRGGADPALGTGLAGVERRLAAFDGVLAISSPSGGPTIATLEIPCGLSSPKTSTS